MTVLSLSFPEKDCLVCHDKARKYDVPGTLRRPEKGFFNKTLRAGNRHFSPFRGAGDGKMEMGGGGLHGHPKRVLVGSRNGRIGSSLAGRNRTSIFSRIITPLMSRPSVQRTLEPCPVGFTRNKGKVLNHRDHRDRRGHKE